MIGGLPLGFAEPWLLAALVALPALWWLLRLTPPRPRRLVFPPTRILKDIAPKDETPAQTPWWLILLRLVAAALVILAAAQPVLNPQDSITTAQAPLLVLIDDGWSAAAQWDARIATADDALASAEASRRSVALMALSETQRELSMTTATAGRVALRQLQPKPYTVVRKEALPVLAKAITTLGPAELLYLSDGVDDGSGATFIAGLAELARDRPLTVIDGGLAAAHALIGAENAAARMTIRLARAAGSAASDGVVRALDARGTAIADTRFTFAADATETEATLDLPVELRNDIARLEIAGERSAGAVHLLDRSWRRRSIGVVSGTSSETAQPLLSPTYYLTRALAPFADLRIADRVAPAVAIAELLDQKLPMLVLADVGSIGAPLNERLVQWIEAGGVLVRFAGPRLAAADDTLVPVRLRRGDRTLGGSLTWEKPQHLARFAEEGPFAGLAVPKDVTVTRQVLAEPDQGLAAKSWASLEDGTPLVTGERRGKGLLVLFHVSADGRWSDLALSGSLVEMLKRIVALSGTMSGTMAGASANSMAGTALPGESRHAARTAETPAPEALTPSRTLDGFGVMGPPPVTAKPLRASNPARASADHPPGFYGLPDSAIAHNVFLRDDRLAPLDLSSLPGRRQGYQSGAPTDLRGVLLALALALFVADAIIAAGLSGALARLSGRSAPATRKVTAAMLVVLVFGTATLTPETLRAAAPDPAAAITQTRLAYVVTGDAATDRIVAAGLEGLTLFLAQRTALEGGDPIGIDPARDELAFYPMIYWPVSADAPKPSQAALDRIGAYMKQGGTVVFDTRDALESTGGFATADTPARIRLREILATLDVPELEPVPRDHVLTKTFYLMHDFPGRFASGTTWVEALARESDDDAAARPARGGDGVSPILITANDLAGAWALRADGQPMLPVDGSDPRQREFAFRAGVNIVMYTLTGNYKADQVHAPALIERLGQ